MLGSDQRKILIFLSTISWYLNRELTITATPLVSAMASLNEGRSYYSVANSEVGERNLKRVSIAISRNMVDGSKKLIQRMDGRIVIQPHEDVIEDVKEKTGL